MRTTKLAFMFGFAALFAGCTSTSVSPDQKVDHATAAVLLYNSSVVLVAEGDTLAEPGFPLVDRSMSRPTKAYLSARTQRVTFFVHDRSSRGRQAVDLSLEAKHVYRLELKTQGADFVVKVWDETSGRDNRSLSKEFRVAGELEQRIRPEPDRIHQ